MNDVKTRRFDTKAINWVFSWNPKTNQPLRFISAFETRKEAIQRSKKALETGLVNEDTIFYIFKALDVVET